MTARYAIYFAPAAETPLARFGAAWLGRDAETGERTARPAIDGLGADYLDKITTSPRRYGFHATLVPPMPLAEGYGREQLEAAARDFARAQPPFRASRLRLADLDGFLALVLAEPCDATHTLAADAVKAFDAFRAPRSEAELERRRRGGQLSARQEAMLTTWGYPYVMDEFRFHMTLTQRLDSTARPPIQRVLGPLTAALCEPPLDVDGFALFEQPDRRAPFRLTRRYAFTG